MNFEGDYRPTLATNFGLFVVKFAAMFALHLLLTPRVRNGLNIMKYANQNPEQFTTDGAVYAYCIGLFETIISMFCIYINIYLLAAQKSITDSLIDYVCLEIVAEFPKLLFEAIVGDGLKEILESPPKIVNSGKNIKFSERSFFHMFARVLYKIVRLFYIAVIFYYMPYAMFLVHWFIQNEPYHTGESEG